MVCSMTAYSRVSAQGSWGMATWEIRTVNHRYFDCVIKMPDFLRSLETNIRQKLQQDLQRGRVECVLNFQPGERGVNLKLNVELLKKLATAITETKKYLPTLATVDPMQVLAWPQILEIIEGDQELIQEPIWQLFTETLADLLIVRGREGLVLGEVITRDLQQILVIVGDITSKITQVFTKQREKIMQRLEEIKKDLDQSRLEQEMVYLAQRLDIAEELARLTAHSQEAQRVLATGGCVGKRLDFLFQELHREANTLAAKSLDVTITQAVVEIKVLIEQMREQTQNIV